MSNGIRALSREVLIAAINRQFEDAKAFYPGLSRESVSVLSIVMPCGKRQSWRTLDDIPAKSVPCPCGDPGHWMIKYDEEPACEHDFVTHGGASEACCRHCHKYEKDVLRDERKR